MMTTNGTCYKCEECGKVFRMIHNVSTKELHNHFQLSLEEKDIYKGDDFFCHGVLKIIPLYQLKMNEELINLQSKWMLIVHREMRGI